MTRLMDRVSSFNKTPKNNFERRWAYKVTYFTQHVGFIIMELSSLLNSRDYVEARILAAQLKQRAKHEKSIQPEFITSDCLAKARKLFNSFLDECINFAELLRVTSILEETGCEELQETPEQIQNSVDRLNLLKDMFTDELCRQGWHQF